MNPDLSKILIVSGLILISIGIFAYFYQYLPWAGKLPGDILIQREKFKIYIPITSCILISIILTALFNLFRK